MNHEIVYERNPTGSYMKIFSNQEENLDEKILLRRKIPGLLPMEKAYLDGNGQYWYNISGKQSLDTYCSIQNVGIDVIKKIIISICSQMEILEWNLISMENLLFKNRINRKTERHRFCKKHILFKWGRSATPITNRICFIIDIPCDVVRTF